MGMCPAFQRPQLCSGFVETVGQDEWAHGVELRDSLRLFLVFDRPEALQEAQLVWPITQRTIDPNACLHDCGILCGNEPRIHLPIDSRPRLASR